MTSIYDIPYEDIQIFLLANNIENEDEAYDIASDLLKDKKSKGHTMSIIEWMMAHNLVIKKIDIPYYTTYEIDNLSQNEINQLAKLLTMNGNNRSNIKNILRYLHKLDDGIIVLLPEITDIIFRNLSDLEKKDIDIESLKPNEIINLLKTHRNKALIRKIIYDNMEKILFYNFLGIDIKRLNDLHYILGLLDRFNEHIMFKIILNNEERFNKSFDIDTVNMIKNSVEYYNDEMYIRGTDIGRFNMDNLVDFIIKLTEIKEIELVKRAIYLINENQLERGFSFSYYLIEKLVYEVDNIEVLKTLINFIGEKVFLENFEMIISHDLLQNTTINFFLEHLVKLEKYDLLIKSLQVLIDKDYTCNGKIIYKILQGIKRAMQSKNDNLIIRYIDIIRPMSVLNTVKSGNRKTNTIRLEKFNRLIKEAEEYE